MCILIHTHFIPYCCWFPHIFTTGWWLIQHNDTEGWGPAAKLQALDEQEDEEDLNDTTTESEIYLL